MLAILLFFGLGGYELLIIGLVLLLLFGGSRMTGLTREIGKGMKMFNDTKATLENELKGGLRPDRPEDSSEKSSSEEK